MKNILAIFVLGLMLIASPANSGAIGMGELKLSDGAVERFIKYLKGGWGNKPMVFLVTADGSGPSSWYCPEAHCEPGNHKYEINACEDWYNKECKVFAKRKIVKWKNDINPGTGKESKFNSKWSDTKIRERLNELGFLY